MIEVEEIRDFLTNFDKLSNIKLVINPKYEQHKLKKSNNIVFVEENKQKVKLETDENYLDTLDEMDRKIKNILGDDFYSYKVGIKDSFIRSILSIINIEFCISSESSKDEMVKEFRYKLAYEIDENFKLLNYSYRKMNKNNIKDILLNEKRLDDKCMLYICDLLNINCIVLYDLHHYYMINNEYDKDKNTVLLLLKKNIYYPLLKTNNQNYISNNSYDKIKKVYQIKNIFNDTKHKKVSKETSSKNNMDVIETAQYMNLKVYKEQETLDKDKVYVSLKNKEGDICYLEKNDLETINFETEKQKEIEQVKKMKVDDLRSIAKNYRVDIYHENNKRKSKKELVEEILKEIMKN